MNKIVVFDLDETLGYFVQFGIFWKTLCQYLDNIKIKIKIKKQLLFNTLLDLYPEFIRPGILSILYYLKYKILIKQCHGVMIYTNNQESVEWVHLIKKYFESKLNCNLFTNVICAFKINGKQIELGRTSHAKLYTDFINCTKLKEGVQICFIDDTYYPHMNNDNVYYIKIKPYIYNLDFTTIINRFVNNNIFKQLIPNKHLFIEFAKENISKYCFIQIEKDKTEYIIDKIITKKIMMELQKFLYNNTLYHES
jgi:hypothetical protein